MIVKGKKMQLNVLDLSILAIRKYSHLNGFTDKFKVTGYTTFKVYDNASDQSVKYYTSLGIDSSQKCLWILHKKFNFQTTKKLNIKHFQ
jgi:hypothetical protein